MIFFNRNARDRVLTALVCAALSLCFGTAIAETVYDNTTTSTGFYQPSGADEIGDEVTLGGTEREVSQLDVRIRSAASGTVDLQARLYDNTGPVTEPDNLLWQSAIMDDVAVDGSTDVSFTVPLVTAPDTVIWTVQISDNQTGGDVGPEFFDPPLVGSSEDFFWQNFSGFIWLPFTFNGDPVVANFYARIETSGDVLIATIDIKPTSDTNVIKCTRVRSIPVAILTTDDFDALDVDHTTVTFEGAFEIHVSNKTGEPRRHEIDVDEDGDMDLILHFSYEETALDCSSTDGMLTGELFDGTLFDGLDLIQMVE